MKASEILKVFAIVIASLFTLSIVFPQDGINIGSLNLRFPSLHSLVESHQTVPVEDNEEPIPEQLGLRDSIAYYHRLVNSGNLGSISTRYAPRFPRTMRLLSSIIPLSTTFSRFPIVMRTG